MSLRDWLPDIAVVGGLAACVLGAVLLNSFVTAPVPSSRDGQNQEQRSAEITSNTQRKAAPIKGHRPSKAEQDCKGTADPKDKEMCLLQSRATDAAREQADYALVSLILTFCTIVLTGIGLIFVKRTLDATATSANAASDSARAATEANVLNREAIIATERPWLNMTIAASGPITFDNGGMHFNLLFIVKNIGKSPALHMWVHAKVHAPRIGIDTPFDPKAMLKAEFDEAKRCSAAFSGYTIFPGDVARQPFSVSIGKADLDAILAGTSFVYANIYCAVGYGSAFDERRHGTSFMVTVERDGNKPRPKTAEMKRSPSTIFPDEGDVPTNEVRFLKSPLVSEYTD